MQDIAIRVENLTKIYKLYDKPIDRMKEALSITRKKYSKEHYALKDISFEIKKGETVGIIGTNGAGKSTLLKIITGVLSQTSGILEVNGKVSALLELGAGFNPEYTGIENIYLNGTMMGYSKEQMDKKINSIIEFADIGEFVNQPVKTYSSGMFARLAFALSINVDPDILIVDEALSVGDAFFQSKCFQKLKEIKKSGTTILFVSHDTGSVKNLCSRAIWIEHGVMQEISDAETVCEKYLSKQIEDRNREIGKMVDKMSADGEIQSVKLGLQKIFKKIEISDAIEVSGTRQGDILSFYILNNKNEEVNVLEVEKEYSFCMLVRFNEELKNVLFGFEMENVKGIKLFSVNNFLTNDVLKIAKKDEIYEVTFTFILPLICKGEYLVSPSLAIGTQDSHVVVERIHNYCKIIIENLGYNLSLLQLETKVSFTKFREDEITLY